MKKLARKNKRILRHAICVAWKAVGIILLIGAFLLLLSIEDGVKYFDLGIIAAVIQFILALVCGFIGYNMVNEAEETDLY